MSSDGSVCLPFKTRYKLSEELLTIAGDEEAAKPSCI